MNIEVYSDGSATTADKPGGFGYVILIDGQKHTEGSGHVPLATNNDMEMEAAIQGLGTVLKLLSENQSSFPQENTVKLISDSQLILGWASGRYRFKQQDKMYKYEQLMRLVRKLRVTTEWVKGHSGNEHNERCDKLANAARLLIQAKEEKKDAKEEGKTLIGTKKVGVVSIWFADQLKIIDLENNIVENYDREVHGQRGSLLEIRADKSR